jgi:hypothetical protein
VNNIVVFNLTGLDLFLLVLILVVADWVLGILRAILPGGPKFQWSLLFKQLQTMGIVLAALFIIGLVTSLTIGGQPAATGPMQGLYTASCTAFALKLLIDMAAKAAAIFAAITPSTPAAAPKA